VAEYNTWAEIDVVNAGGAVAEYHAWQGAVQTTKRSEIGEIITEANRLCDLLGRIKRHWEDGCHEDDDPWDETMRELLNEVGR
jgi:hypothetical protein